MTEKPARFTDEEKERNLALADRIFSMLVEETPDVSNGSDVLEMVFAMMCAQAADDEAGVRAYLEESVKRIMNYWPVAASEIEGTGWH